VSEGIKLTLLLKSKVVVRHLIGNLLFKGINVMDWYLLHDYVSLNLKSSEQEYFACLCGILSESSGTRKGVLRSFESRTRPIRKKLKDIRLKGKKIFGGFSDLCLFLKVPERCLESQQLYTAVEVGWLNQPPKEQNRIGVGYKDKGSLGSVFFVEPPATEELLSDYFEERSFLDLWFEIASYP
jgi:hypothetical protein